MRRTTFVCAALLLVGGFATGGQAQVCLDFKHFVDGLELVVNGKRITGFWRNYDGDGSDSPVFGTIQDGLPLACHRGNPNPPRAGVACLQELGCMDLFGWDWYFLLDGLDGTMQEGLDINDELGPPGACVYDELEYYVLLGPCPFGPQPGGPTLMSVTRERLREQGLLREELP